ncbi:MAG: DUF6339 family protein [Acidimicrobiales bacterium]
MSLHILRESALSQLRSNIGGNVSKYSFEKPWINEEFRDSHWLLKTNLELPGHFELLLPDEDSTHDLENAKRLFLALKHLTPVQAADERLWACLSHTVGWRYMRKRWDVDKFRGNAEKRKQYIRDRYFFMPNRDRALVRNGIARLWTYAYVTYDKQRNDPFQLTEVLLQKLDIAQQLLERSFSRVPKLPKAVMRVLQTYPKDQLDLTDRDRFRDVMRHVNRVGGVTILDMLNDLELEQLVRDRADTLASRAHGSAA